MAHFRAIFIILCLTSLMILTVQIRIVNNRNFYKWRAATVEQARLKQTLYQHQIQLESLTNSASLTRQLLKSLVGEEKISR